MKDLYPWRQRALWRALGAGLAFAASFAVGGCHEPEASRPQTASAAPLAANAAGPVAARPPECYLGVILARQSVDVTAEIEGLVERMGPRAGDLVERGEVIATLDNWPLKHRLTIERAAQRTAEAARRRQEIEVDRAEQKYERSLALQDLVSQEDREDSRFQREAALAQLEQMEAEVSRLTAQIEQLEAMLSRSEIRAPFAGTVAHRYVDAGANVSAGAPIVRLISGESFLTRFAVPPDEIAALPIGTPVRVEFENLGRSLDGTVEQVAPEIDAGSQMIFVEAGLSLANANANDRTLPSGGAARVSVARSNLRRPSCLDAARGGL